MVLTRTDRTFLVTKIKFGHHAKYLNIENCVAFQISIVEGRFLILIIIIIHFIYTLKSKVQVLFSSRHIVKSKYKIIQVINKLEYVYINQKLINK